MRSPSHFIFTTLVACVGLAFASSASADSAEQSAAAELGSFRSIERVDFGDAHEKQAAARVDERLSLSLSGPTSMECSSNDETGFETCVVRTQAATASMPAAMAQN